MLKAQGKAAHELSDLLGDDHDLAVLAERIRGGTFVDDAAILDLVARRRATLQDEALRLARRLYAEPPKAYRGGSRPTCASAAPNGPPRADRQRSSIASS